MTHRIPSPGRDETIEQVSEPRLGVPARVTFDHPPSGQGLELRRIEHLQFGITGT
jgi:hypothetical protein